MAKDILLDLLFAMKIEFGFILLFAVALGFGLRSKLSRYWQGRILIGLVSVTAITFLAFTYVAFSNGMIRWL